MSWSAIGLHLLALLGYPGLLLIVAVGLLAEAAVALAVDRRRLRAAAVAPVVRLRISTVRSWPLLLPAALLSTLAATQLAAPANPVSPAERNLLVAAVSVAAAIWLGWAWAWSASGARASLLGQACWLVALMAPALLSETLRPQVLGAVAVPAQLPLKAASGLLYLACLPLLLLLVGELPWVQVAAVRPLLWVPFCGLGVSVFLPPVPDDVGGAARFIGATLGVALTAIALAAALRRPSRREPRSLSLYLRVVAGLAGAVLAVTLVTAVLTSAMV